jgi:hypothetical protein
MRIEPRLAGFGLPLVAAPLAAAGLATAMVHVGVTILRPVDVMQTQELGGEVAAGEVTGQVVVDPAPASGRKAASLSLKPAAFRVIGRSGAAFSLALPAAADSVLTASGASLPVERFQVSVAGRPPSETPGGLALDGGGRQDFKVGVTLRVAKDQPKAFYRGRCHVTMAYN